VVVDVIVGGKGAEVWVACGARRLRRYTSLWRLWRPGWRPDLSTHVRLLSFTRRGGSGRGRLRLVGLRSPTFEDGNLLVVFVAPDLAPSRAHARAAVFVFALWCFWRGGGKDFKVWSAC